MPTTTYAHFRDVPDSACRGTGAIKIDSEAMDKLQSLRNRLGKPLIVRSGYRSLSHNCAVGGAPASMIPHGHAVCRVRKGAQLCTWRKGTPRLLLSPHHDPAR